MENQGAYAAYDHKQNKHEPHYYLDYADSLNAVLFRHAPVEHQCQYGKNNSEAEKQQRNPI